MARTPPAPPQAVEAEHTVLSAMLQSASALAAGADALTEDDFTDRGRATVFCQMVELYRRGETVDVVTLSEALALTGRLEAVGGMPALGELLDLAVFESTDVQPYLALVRDRSARRQLGRAAAEIVRDLAEPLELRELLERAERRVFAVADGARQGDGELRAARSLVYPAFARIESGGLRGLSTGYRSLDEKLTPQGTLGGQLVIVAGRPGMGKSVVGLQMLLSAALESQVPAAGFSLEMTAEEWMLRALAVESITDLQLLARGIIPPGAEHRLQQAAGAIHAAPLWIDDTPSQSVPQIRAKCRRMKAERGLGLVVVDYLQYMTASAENRVQEIGKITRGLKALAKELDVPVVALCQLSRAPELRADHRPVLSDLRESGDIEQDADTVWLLYRPEYYHGPTHEGQNIAGHTELIVAKQRSGPTGTVPLHFRADCVRFDDATTPLRRTA